jgi:hypothetical protein
MLPVCHFSREATIDYFKNRPPSLSLAFARSLTSFAAPSLSQQQIDEVFGVLTPVHPEFGYLGLKVWDKVTRSSQIRSGLLVENPLDEIKRPSRESLNVLHSLMDNRRFSEKKEAVMLALHSAVSEESNVWYAAAVADVVIKHRIEVELSDDFVNRGVFLFVYVAIGRIAKKLGKPELLESMKEKLRSWEKKSILENAADLKVVGRIVHNEF